MSLFRTSTFQLTILYALMLAVSSIQDHSIVPKVADSGCGIAKDEREKVTRRFYRVDQSRNKAGSGLGLSLVQVIVSCHGAELGLTDNAPGLCVEVVFFP
jgi:signal transduction histidine kinase